MVKVTVEKSGERGRAHAQGAAEEHALEQTPQVMRRGPAGLPPFLANAPTAVDKRQRILYLKKLKPSDRLQVSLQLGEHADNKAVSLQAILASHVRRDLRSCAGG